MTYHTKTAYTHIIKIITSYCTVLDFIHECFFCFYFDEALAESKYKQNKYEWIKSKYSAITVLLYTCVTHHDKKKKRTICSFSWQIGKLKIFHAKCRLFYLILIFGIIQKIYQKQKKFNFFFFQKNNFQKKSSSGNNWYLHGWAAV